jgi:hypothetical protein
MAGSPLARRFGLCLALALLALVVLAGSEASAHHPFQVMRARPAGRSLTV